MTAMPLSNGPRAAPRVTVLTTVFNGEKYLDETIASVLASDYDDFEYVVVDDGSTDSTPAILEKWRSQDPRIVVLRNEANRGIPAAANIGLAAARGAYIARIDGDDLSEPGRLSIQVQVLDQQPDVVMVSMNYYLMRSDGRILRTTRHDAPPEVIEYLLNFGNAVGGHSQVMYRRAPVMALGGYDETFPVALDYELWTRLVRVGRILILPTAGMRYRLHAESISSRSAARQRNVSAEISRRALNRYLGREVTDHELLAVTTLWRRRHPAGDLAAAQSVLREAYGIFRTREGKDATLLKRVREETARYIVGMAVALAWRGEVMAAWRHLMAGAGWDIGSSIRTLLRLVRLAFFDQWIKLRSRKRT